LRGRARYAGTAVSPTSIRSRILKEESENNLENIFDIVSPTSIRSRILKEMGHRSKWCHGRCFTHVDPFEDTESWPTLQDRIELRRFTHVDPFEDTERVSPEK